MDELTENQIRSQMLDLLAPFLRPSSPLVREALGLPDGLTPYDVLLSMETIWPASLTRDQAQQLGDVMAQQAMQEEPIDG